MNARDMVLRVGLVSLGVFFGIQAILATPLAYAKPPPWAPAWGHRAKHRYYYYPQAQVYYSPVTHQYFWLDGGAWRVGVRLPSSVVIGPERVMVDLDSEIPYTRHPEVILRFPIGR